MSKKMFMLISLIFAFSTLFAQYKYIGVDKCKGCHSKAAKGDQFNKWKADKHFSAYTSLATEKGKEIAKKNNIADPQKDDGCLDCHSTHGSVKKEDIATLTVEEGVSCESCHGPGSVYKSPAIMTKQAQALKNGLIIPNADTCKKCHAGTNKYHTNKPFVFEDAMKEIAHPNPSK